MKKKKILIVGPTDFGICDSIKRSLLEGGHDVLFVPEMFRSGIMLIDRVISRLPDRFLSSWLSKRIVSRACRSGFSDTDILLIIRGRYLNAQALNYIDQALVIDRKIMYQWDSSKSLPLFREQIGFFDSVLTFDFNDACKFGIKHRHLFHFTPEELSRNDMASEYSVCFIGTLHTDRGASVAEFLEENDRFMETAFVSLYIPFLTYLWHRASRSPLTTGVKWKHLSFSPIKPDENRRLMLNSSLVLDIAEPDQAGFTLRTFEALGLKKKLISTYRSIASEDFYNSNNICVVGRGDWGVPTSFESLPYIELDCELNQKYAVEGWIQDVLDL